MNLKNTRQHSNDFMINHHVLLDMRRRYLKPEVKSLDLVGLVQGSGSVPNDDSVHGDPD